MSDEEKQEVKLPLVYVGPTSARLALVKFHLYKALNANVQAVLEKVPGLKNLFIPLEEFGVRSRAVFAGTDASVNHIVKSLTKREVI